MSWEGKLRRLVWLFRDEPETFARVAAIAGAVFGVVMLHKLRKYSASFEGPAHDLSLVQGSAAAGGKHLRATLQRALRFAQSAGALYPLGVGETAICRDRGIPVRRFSLLLCRGPGGSDTSGGSGLVLFEAAVGRRGVGWDIGTERQVVVAWNYIFDSMLMACVPSLGVCCSRAALQSLKPVAFVFKRIHAKAAPPL